MIKLSIITICFNEKDRIEKTLLSVISQKFKNYEFIIIDGDSTDGTKDIIEKYKENITVFISEKDRGIYDAMNKGINNSNGEYLLFLNGGDYLYSNDTLQEVFEKYNPIMINYDIVYGNIIVMSNGSIFKGKKPFLSNSLFLFIGSFPHQAAFIKRELFINDGLYDDNFRIVGDQEFFVREIIKNKKKIIHIPLIISFYDNQNYSISEDKNLSDKRNMEKMIILKKYFNKFELIFYPLLAKIAKLLLIIKDRLKQKTNKNKQNSKIDKRE